MGICINFICPKKTEKLSKSGTNINSQSIKFNFSPENNKSQIQNPKKNLSTSPNLNNSLKNIINDNINSSTYPLSTKQNKFSIISEQTPKLKYSSLISKNILLKSCRLSKLNKSNISKQLKKSESSQLKYSNLKDKIKCFFCGKNCKFENYLYNKNKPNAIKGLNSNFITEKIIIGQRPSDKLIQDYNLIEQFKKLNIGLIINLEKEGEHPFCGPNANKLSNSGYSYNPSNFSGNDIIVKFFSWKEIKSELSINFILQIVKEISIFVYNKKQKVYIHCHSGNRRSGVIIACYLIYNSNDSVSNVVKFIKDKRNSCFESKSEIKQINIFYKFIETSRIIYGKKEKIDVYLKRQDDLLFGDESEKFGYVPKIITKSLERILEIKFKYNLDNLVIIKLLKGLENNWSDELEKVLYLIKQNINKNDWNIFQMNENLNIFVELLFDFCEDSTFYIINPEKIDILTKFAPFAKFINQNNFFLTNQQKIDTLSYIRKVLFGFEYSVIFQISSFCAILYENNNLNENFNILFNEMIDRFSMELQGFHLSDIQLLKSENDIIEKRINALSSIINLITKEILFSKNSFNENKKFKILLFPTKSNYNFLNVLTNIKRVSKEISSIETMTLTNHKNSFINVQDESSNDLLGNNLNTIEKINQIKNCFPNTKQSNNNLSIKKEIKQIGIIGNAFTFNNSPKSKKSNINPPLSKSQSSLLTFQIYINNSNNNSNKLKMPSNQNSKIKSHNSSLINEIQNYQGRKSSSYKGIILK
jgi:hypothetical protein